ncbi:MAG: S8 family serine peptidase [Acidobacteriota bacterium]|nr:S8 family serine peptidase [Acidobacteriota bacterium]
MITRSRCLWLLLCAAVLSAASSVSAATAGPRLREPLSRVLDEAAPGEWIPVYFVLAEQLTGPALRERVAGVADRDQRRRIVVGALKAHAERTQLRLRRELQRLESLGRARRVRYLWIGNIVAADLSAEEIRRLSTLDEIDHVSYSPKVDVSLDQPLTPVRETSPLAAYLAPAAGVDEIECGVDLMNAPLVWNDLGVTGEGAVIAVIDSGTCWYHSDIENQVWVNPGEDLDGDGVVMDADDENGVDDDGNGYVDDLVGYDIDQGDNDPNDDNSHGSHTAGTVAGDGTAGTQAGMAPDARVMILRVGLQFSDEPDVWEAMQYAADNGADAISMSLGWPHNQNPDRATWRTNCENTIDAGTAMVIAAGNEGSGSEPDNVRTPGDVPRVITVGATDCSDQAASFSSRGPVTWEDVPPFNDHPYPPGLIKPDVSAPGVNTKSHNLCSGYSTKSGTSMATPHVAGTVALMVANDPDLTPDDIKLLLEDSSVDLGEPGKDNTYGTGRVDAYEAVLLTANSDGRMSIRERASNCAGTLSLVVTDADLKGGGTLDVDVTSNTEPTAEVITLVETGPATGVFRGEIPVDGGPPQADGAIQVVDGDVVTATYIDADNGAGGTNIPKTDTADIDCSEPLITDVRDEGATLTSVSIKWSTDERSDSLVEYGPAIPPTLEQADGRLVQQHSVLLSRLDECTVYYYRVTSVDALGNRAMDDRNGQFYHFETLGDFGEGPQSCHAGKVTIDLDFYSCADTVGITVTDLDLNLDSGAVDTVTVEVTSTTETVGEWVQLTETGSDTSRFTGSIGTATGSPVADGRLQLADGDRITVTYLDADDGTGAAAVAYDTARADCAGPVISDLRVEAITDERATVSWTTQEPADSVVEWGLTPELGRTTAAASLVTSHSVVLHEFQSCGTVYFRVRSTDEFGYTTVRDRHGASFAFDLGLVPGLYWKESFEQGSGSWTLEGEWEFGPAQGAGGSSGRPDPAEAYNNAGVLGHDLSGQGAHPGDYEPSTVESAYTPFLDASSWTRTKLIVYKQLHAGNGDEASIWLWTDAGRPLFRSEGLVDDAAWEKLEYDLGTFVDGRPSMRIQFRQSADAGAQYSGWTIDDVILKDGSLPDYGPCGGCTGAPSFAGAVSATDNDACGASGVTVSWNAAVSWGTGGGGTYAVYRAEQPDFAPGPTNLVASGITTLSYDDTSAPTDRQLFYVVRAENDETCSTGPAGGGVMDDNNVHVAVQETTSRELPAEVVGLGATLYGHVHLRLEWHAVAEASVYRVYRSESPQPGSFVLLGESEGLFYDDENVGSDGKTYYYLVRAANACGDEGP